MEKNQECAVHIGIDIGGSNNKICILSLSNLNIPSTKTIQIKIKSQNYFLYAYSSNHYPTYWNYLQQIKKEIKGTAQLVGTGGTIAKATQISKLFQVEIKQVGEFDAHCAGLQFYKNANLPLTVESFKKSIEGEIEITSKTDSQWVWSDLLFMSLGSGVNFQLYGEGQNGFQRKKAKDPSLTATGDGYFLEGTCLGAGFLMGIGRLLTEQADFSAILSKMKNQEDLKEYYESIIINLFQMAINMSVLHDQKNLLMTGSLLAFDIDITKLMKRALSYNHIKCSIQFTVILLQELEGYLGTLGSIQTSIK